MSTSYGPSAAAPVTADVAAITDRPSVATPVTTDVAALTDCMKRLNDSFMKEMDEHRMEMDEHRKEMDERMKEMEERMKDRMDKALDERLAPLMDRMTQLQLAVNQSDTYSGVPEDTDRDNIDLRNQRLLQQLQALNFPEHHVVVVVVSVNPTQLLPMEQILTILSFDPRSRNVETIESVEASVRTDLADLAEHNMMWFVMAQGRVRLLKEADRVTNIGTLCTMDEMGVPAVGQQGEELQDDALQIIIRQLEAEVQLAEIQCLICACIRS